MDVTSFFVASSLWHLTYLATSSLLTHALSHPSSHAFLPSKSVRLRLQQEAPAYILSTIHAVIVTTRGLQHLRILLHAPVHIQLQHPPPALAASLPLAVLPFAAETRRVLDTNILLATYLFADLVHILRQYPALGGLDTVLHHLAFLLCAVVAGAYNLCPFMFSWLIIGEASTPFLNLRWFLIRSGYGDAWFFRPVQMIFALLFVVTRFFVYGAGMAYQFTIVSDVPDTVPRWAVVITLGSVVAGFVLNLTWLNKIWRLATGETRNQPEAHREKAA
ncbi:unnamed protein product [Chondrus crispus]|uniref:TLC domain-containing protein n=1 Tax=Chondrus crispus TaxID=2769 RepID=R7QSB7_CHOCR|nr:unnamed protein product [Chondrus crispus]CDF40285.1 unnamed protein product [Chondrus crispus]|eukprot:XP_005710579.1 unnamed protein product [Chondrus crispus]